MRQLTQPILVGVTGAGENTEALRFALAEARTLGVGVTLVHAVHPLLPPPPPSVLLTDDSWSDVGATIVGEARRELEELIAGVSLSVRTTLGHGHPGGVLADLSEDATMIVLQHRNLSRLHRIVTGATVASVATHAHCPVVSVPPVDTRESPTGVITVGLHDDGGPRPVLEAAFAAASNHHRSLRCVHAWRLEPAYDDIAAGRPELADRTTASLNAATAELTAKYPDVPVTVDVRHDWPAETLVGAAQESDLVVIGRHHGLPVLPARLGSLARAVIAHASCPVMIVPL